MTAPTCFCRSASLPFLVWAFALIAGFGCSQRLSSTTVQSADGSLVAHVPAEAGWVCSANDVAKDTWKHAGVKCKHDAASLVWNAKLYEVDTESARTAEVFCIQDWKQLYGGLFHTLVTTSAKVEPFRGVPACHVILEGTTDKGPWRLEEIDAPNGRKLLQITVNGSLPSWQQRRDVVEAWLMDLRYDLRVPGQG